MFFSTRLNNAFVDRLFCAFECSLISEMRKVTFLRVAALLLLMSQIAAGYLWRIKYAKDKYSQRDSQARYRSRRVFCDKACIFPSSEQLLIHDHKDRIFEDFFSSLYVGCRIWMHSLYYRSKQCKSKLHLCMLLADWDWLKTSTKIWSTVVRTLHTCSAWR